MCTHAYIYIYAYAYIYITSRVHMYMYAYLSMTSIYIYIWRHIHIHIYIHAVTRAHTHTHALARHVLTRRITDRPRPRRPRHMYQIAANMQTVTLVLVTPVLQAAHWLIRKQVHSGDQPLHPLHRWARLITGALAPLPEISLANDCIKGSLGHHVQVCTHTHKPWCSRASSCPT